MNHKPNRFNDILTNIVTGVTITAWGTAVMAGSSDRCNT